MNGPTSLRFSHTACCRSGPLAKHLNGGAEQLGDGLLARREQECRGTDNLEQFRSRAIGVGRGGHGSEYIVARFVSPVCEVCTELVVQVPEWIEAHRLAVEGADSAFGLSGAKSAAESRRGPPPARPRGR